MYVMFERGKISFDSGLIGEQGTFFCYIVANPLTIAPCPKVLVRL
jgi:hypothetical protein